MAETTSRLDYELLQNYAGYVPPFATRMPDLAESARDLTSMMFITPIRLPQRNRRQSSQ